MKQISSTILCILVLAGGVFPCPAQSPGPMLQLERHTNALDLTVSSLSTTGALFVLQATNVQSLVESPSLLLQTNNMPTNDVQLLLTPDAGPPRQAFYSAIFFPGQSVDNFGDPEGDEPETNATILLFTSGAVDHLTNGIPFFVAFLVADPSGQPVPLNGTATLFVVSDRNGTIHPDAAVTPPTGEMTNGFLRMQITVNAMTSLSGYTLTLSLDTNAPPTGGIRAQSSTSDLLKWGFNLGIGPVYLTGAEMSAALEDLRATFADPVSYSWDPPLTNGYDRVAGSFGEWRGDNNKRTHHGLDLPAPTNSTVLASRAGVVAATNNISGIGYYVTIDHGDGWFSRYLHLDGNHILVKPGQPVFRGTPIADELYHRTGWGVHLHFEARYDRKHAAHWGPGLPGVAQDPVLIPGIPIPSATSVPQIDIFGLTSKNPGKTIFDTNKPPPSTDGTGLAYVFVKTSDIETYTYPNHGHNNPGPHSVSFWPGGPVPVQTITPTNDDVIKTYLPFGSDANEGFARYNLVPRPTHANPTNRVANRRDYFRYWFKWDTSSYSSSPIGPRSFTMSVQGYSGSTTNYTFTYGPQIQRDSVRLVGNQQYVFTNVAYLGTNTTALSQPDQYKVQIIQTNGQPLTNVTWDSPLKSYPDFALTPAVKTNLQTNGYSFKLPADTDAAGLKLRLSSRLVPDIADAFPFDSWVRYYELGDYQVHALEVDGSGNVIVTGRPANNYVGNYTTIKYSPTGVALWTNRDTNMDADGYDFGLEPVAVAVDRTGNVFVTGHSVIWTNDDTQDVYATLAYSSVGVPLWTTYYAGTNRADHAYPKAVATDNA